VQLLKTNSRELRAKYNFPYSSEMKSSDKSFALYVEITGTSSIFLIKIVLAATQHKVVSQSEMASGGCIAHLPYHPSTLFPISIYRI
jgi:hypothetical protein